LRLLLVNLFDKNEPQATGREQKREEIREKGQEEKSGLRILILLKESPLFRHLG
jgi:hypothetical protein